MNEAVLKNDVTVVQTILDQEPWLANRLLQAGADHSSFLYLAATGGFVETAKLLLCANADVNQQCSHGSTPLIIAATNGHVEVVQAFLERSEIVVDLFDDLRQTPLHYATSNNHQTIVSLLLEAKATTAALVYNSSTTRKQLFQVNFCWKIALFSNCRAGVCKSS